MRKKTALLLVLIILSAAFVYAPKPVLGIAAKENTWTEKAPMPAAREQLQVAVVNGSIYAIGGAGPRGTNEEYNPETNNWTTKASIPTPQQSFAIAVYQEKIYCIGGLNGSMSAMTQVYDPAANSWENKAPMPTARYGLQANVVDDKIYLIGGVKWKEGYNQGFQLLNNTEVYDPLNDTWTTKASMPNPEGYVSAVVNKKIYVIGPGLTQIYNPQTDTWSTGLPSPINITAGGENGVATAAAATTGVMAPKRIYVYDGSSLQVYDPQNDNWTLEAAPPVSRQYLGIANVNDMLYFIGGETEDPSGQPWYGGVLGSSSNEQYTPIGYGTIPAPTILPPTKTEPFPTVPFSSFTIAVSVLIVAGLLIYFKQRKGSRNK